MNDEQAVAAAGRLLLRYGWKPSPEDMRRLVGTERQSAMNRVMNDPDAQRAAVAELEASDDVAANELVDHCRARRHTEASALARRIVSTLD